MVDTLDTSTVGSDIHDQWISCSTVLAGTIGLTVATIGYDGARTLSYPARVLFLVTAFSAMFGTVIHVGVQHLAAAFIVTALAHARFVVGHDVETEPASTTTD